MNDKFYVFRTGWEFKKSQILKDGTYLEYVDMMPSWETYQEEMQLRIWDFTRRYLSRFLRLTDCDLLQLRDYLSVLK